MDFDKIFGRDQLDICRKHPFPYFAPIFHPQCIFNGIAKVYYYLPDGSKEKKRTSLWRFVLSEYF